MEQHFPKPDPHTRQHPHEARVLLESPRRPQAPHRAAVVFRADVALRAVFRHDVGETGCHDEDGQARRRAPIVVDAVGGVVGVVLEVDEAAVLGPNARHAVASLVRAECSAGNLISRVLGFDMMDGQMRTDWAITM